MQPCNEQADDGKILDDFTHAVVIDAPIDDVYAALTQADNIQEWWSAWVGCTIDDITLTPEKGAKFAIHSVTQSGQENHIKGRILYIDKNLMVFTWSSLISKAHPTTVALRLSSIEDDKSYLKLEQSGFRTHREKSIYSQGWKEIMETMQIGIPWLRKDGLCPEVLRYHDQY